MSTDFWKGVGGVEIKHWLKNLLYSFLNHFLFKSKPTIFKLQKWEAEIFSKNRNTPTHTTCNVPTLEFSCNLRVVGPISEQKTGYTASEKRGQWLSKNFWCLPQPGQLADRSSRSNNSDNWEARPVIKNIMYISKEF